MEVGGDNSPKDYVNVGLSGLVGGLGGAVVAHIIGVVYVGEVCTGGEGGSIEVNLFGMLGWVPSVPASGVHRSLGSGSSLSAGMPVVFLREERGPAGTVIGASQVADVVWVERGG